MDVPFPPKLAFTLLLIIILSHIILIEEIQYFNLDNSNHNLIYKHL